ncbi:MAG: GspH/FimT family pseudopilin, partial [Nitrospirota bacterium]|nr:GspH/FimT family pseudopilin [Nitrospirota bacterium]
MKDRKGVTLIELLIVLAIIGILSAIGIPEYGRFIAKSKVRQAANDLLQNMRLARTMAIKENRAYLLTFNYPANNYLIGFDGDSNGALFDAADGYGSGAVRTIDIRTVYGQNIIMGSGSFTTLPPNGPNGTDITDNAMTFQFDPDGSASPNGRIYIQHNGTDRGYSFCVELANASGMI